MNDTRLEQKLLTDSTTNSNVNPEQSNQQQQQSIDQVDNNPSNGIPKNCKKTWSPAVLEDKFVRKEIMITAKNGHISNDTSVPNNNNSVEMRRRSIENNDAFKKFDIPKKQISNNSPTNWRKDEKSEKSVRDKIAMFSNDDIVDKPTLGPRKSLNKSTENLLSDRKGSTSSDSVLSMPPLSKKAQSVENLDDKLIGSRLQSTYDYNLYGPDSCTSNGSGSFCSSDYSSAPYMSKAFSVENLNFRIETPIVESKKLTTSTYAVSSTPSIPPSYASLPRSKPPSVARTTSFSGSCGNGNYEDRRRSSISSLLEQRKKSMSKLRGLIIPEKSILGEDDTGHIVIDLPEIKSKEAQKVQVPSYSLNQNVQHHSKREPVVPNPRHYTPAYQSLSPPTDQPYKSIFGNGSNRPLSSQQARSSDTRATFKKPQSPILPPVKPPRTSLILAGTRSTSSDSQKSANHIDDSEDSDSVFSSKISSPPSSPVMAAPPGQFALTRTLSSETNTSIASSTTSTLTSGSGSQASCSSAGSTPTIDMSRKISKSSSNESYVNRKNILALAKCRSGKDESLLVHRQQRRYDDEDSTDGYDDEEIRHAPKPKQRSALVINNKTTIHNSVVDTSTPINYRLVSSEDNLVDRMINVASYVEVTSDTDGDSKNSDTSPLKINAKFIDEERRASFKAPIVVAEVVVKPNVKPTLTTQIDKQPSENNDLAKWVRSEVAKSKLLSETSKKIAPPKLSVSENIQKFNKTSNQELPKTPATSTPVTPQSATISLNDKKKQRTLEFRKAFEPKPTNGHTNQNIIAPSTPPAKSTKDKKPVVHSYHERFSSLDSLASSSSGISSSQASSLLEPSPTQNLQSPSTDFGSFSSFGSNHSLITPADLQLILEEADPPLKTPDASVVVLQRDSPECSVGVTLAGGADYETKEITVSVEILSFL